jgi:hypothetical protein
VGGFSVGGQDAWNPRRAVDLQEIRAANATWVRGDVQWQYLEAIPGKWEWQLFDPVIEDTTAAGLRYLVVLHTVPAWANGNGGDYAPPTDRSLFADYCFQVARRYIPHDVTDYQIGNEVNLPHPGWPNPTGAAYVRDYLNPCADAVYRAANELGVRVNVMAGSLGPNEWTGGAIPPAEFLADVYRNGGGGHFDSVSWHPYTNPGELAGNPQMTSYATALYDIMAAHGDGAKKIWATEFGIPTEGPYSVTERAQADDVDIAIDTWYQLPFAGPLLWYSLRDAGTSPTDREQHYGVLRHDGTPKPAYTRLADRFLR